MGRLPFYEAFGIFLMLAAIFPQQVQAGQPVVFEIDGAKKQPISPYIYGTNQPDWQGHSKYLTLVRWGETGSPRTTGKPTPRTPVPTGNIRTTIILSKSDVPGEPVRKLVADAHAADAAVVVTIPMAGYVAADKAGDGDVNRTPDYLKTRFLPSVPRKKARFAFPPDLRDGRVFQDEFVWWLERTFPEARKDPRRTIFYALDNEPDLWSSTHARIHPQEGQLRRNCPAGYRICGGDQGRRAQGPGLRAGELRLAGISSTLQDAPDAQGRDFLDFYLQQMRMAEQKATTPAAGRARRALVSRGAGRQSAYQRGRRRARRRRRPRAGPPVALGPQLHGEELDHAVEHP